MNNLLSLYDHKGETIAAFVLGHVQPSNALTEGEKAIIASRFCVAVSDLSDVAKVQLFHINRTRANRDCDEWQLCQASAPGAVAVTGYIF